MSLQVRRLLQAEFLRLCRAAFAGQGTGSATAGAGFSALCNLNLQPYRALGLRV